MPSAEEHDHWRPPSPLVAGVMRAVAVLATGEQLRALTLSVARTKGTGDPQRESDRSLILADWRTRRYPAYWLNRHPGLATWSGALDACGPLLSTDDAVERVGVLRRLACVAEAAPPYAVPAAVQPAQVAGVLRRAEGVAERVAGPRARDLALLEFGEGELAEISRFVVAGGLRQEVLDLVDRLVNPRLAGDRTPLADSLEDWLRGGTGHVAG